MPNIYSQLISAQLENKTSDYTAGTRGRVWWNTANLKVMSDDGTNVRALLRNDQACVFGNHATANSNIRFQRGAASVLQFVLGGDTTAEGTLSTALAQTSSRVENYATGSLPTFGNAGRLLFDTTTTGLKLDNGAAIKELVTADLAQTLTNKIYDTASNTFKATGAAANSVLQADGGGNTSWAVLSGALDAPSYFLNGSLAVSVAGNAMTVALKNNAGSDASAGSPVKIAFRNATQTTGDTTVVSVTGALSVVIPSGAELGLVSAVNQYIYVWALNNAGVAELVVSGSRDFDEGDLQSTTAISSGADLHTVLYSTTSRSSKAIRLLGRIVSNQAATGTYASAATRIELCQGIPWLRETPWKSDLSFTISGWGAVTDNTMYYRRVVDTMFVRGHHHNAAVDGAPGYIQLPSGYTIDTTKISTSSAFAIVGHISRAVAASTAVEEFMLIFDGSTLDKVYLSASYSGDDQLAKTNVNALFGATEGAHYEFSVPIKEWRSY